MHFLQLVLGASSLAIAFSLPNAFSSLDSPTGSNRQQSQVSLDSRRLSRDQITSDSHGHIKLTSKTQSGAQSTKQSSMKLQKRSGSFQLLPVEMVEGILERAMNFMYYAKKSLVAYTWCEVICLAYHDFVEGSLHPADPDLDRRFRYCHNFCDTPDSNDSIRKEYTRYELMLQSKFGEYSIQEDEDERQRWRTLPGDPNWNFKLHDLKDGIKQAGTNLAAGVSRIAGAVSKVGSPNGKSGGYMGGLPLPQLEAVP
ncbi:MAG: hypothetical protein M1816_002585 [Peltula sp. TS41687]|nr:MAG: hypothetical protein M1816_002585 [Peltula sp. TS41687]